MLACVVISYVDQGLCAKRNSEEERVKFFVTSSSNVAGRLKAVELEHAGAVCLCVVKLSCAIGFIIITYGIFG